MAQVAGPYGLRPVKVLGDTPFPGGVNTYLLTTNQASGFYFGDPVGLIGGQPVPITASPTTAAGANQPIGIFMGCSYQDAIRGFVNSQFLPPNAITAGATQVKLKIADNPSLVMRVQANGVVTTNQIGLNAQLVGPFAGGTPAVGNSVVGIDAPSIAGTSTFAVRIYGFVYEAAPSPGAGSMPGDPFTDVLVVWNFGVHRFENATGQ